MPDTRRDSPLFSALVVLSSFLLFVLEPMIGKQILPWFGGAAAVWATCLVFYQTALLTGYFYATRLGRNRALHSVAIVVSLVMLPIGPSDTWHSPSELHPVWRILALLTSSVALPFILLSSTGPLLQQRLASDDTKEPYWLYVLSNAASLVGLFSYPLWIEPYFSLSVQRWLWSGAYIIFAGLSLIALRRTEFQTRRTRPRLKFLGVLLWFGLAAGGSMLLLSVTNQLTENVAPVPLLWVLPLATYLASFMLAFTGLAGKRAIWSGFGIAGLALIANAIYNIDSIEPIQITLPVMLLGLFGGAMLCHTELYLRRPDPLNLTAFYVAIAAGGAAGSIFVGIIAPNLFTGISELPMSMLFVALLAIAVTWDRGNIYRLLWAGVAAGMCAVFVVNVQAFSTNALARMRSFYGALRVTQSGLGYEQQRALFHGRIEHGAQFLLPPMRERPTTYYAPDSGIGIALRECLPQPKRVGVVGLGIGTLAAYGGQGDSFEFYEINPQILGLAGADFFYLRESKATVEMQLGDARLVLEHDTRHHFHLLAIDAFSGDAIPVHLLTREALRIYRKHLDAAGIIAFHVSNDYLDLASVVESLAGDAHMSAALFRNYSDDQTLTLASDWVLVTDKPQIFDNPGLKLHRVPFSGRRVPVWTDDHNNLLGVFKLPAITTPSGGSR